MFVMHTTCTHFETKFTVKLLVKAKEVLHSLKLLQFISAEKFPNQAKSRKEKYIFGNQIAMFYPIWNKNFNKHLASCIPFQKLTWLAIAIWKFSVSLKCGWNVANAVCGVYNSMEQMGADKDISFPCIAHCTPYHKSNEMKMSSSIP